MTDAPITPQPVTPPPAAPVYAAAVPGKTLGIVALIVSFFFSVIGIILGFVARSQSKAAGVKNTPATVAIVLGFIFLVFTIIGLISIPLALGAACSGLEPGVYTDGNGGTLTCG